MKTSSCPLMKLYVYIGYEAVGSALCGVWLEHMNLIILIFQNMDLKCVVMMGK